jgi:predicted HNH restriction endonuclease
MVNREIFNIIKSLNYSSNHLVTSLGSSLDKNLNLPVKTAYTLIVRGMSRNIVYSVNTPKPTDRVIAVLMRILITTFHRKKARFMFSMVKVLELSVNTCVVTKKNLMLLVISLTPKILKVSRVILFVLENLIKNYDLETI